jgi:hypothetical protein
MNSPRWTISAVTVLASLCYAFDPDQVAQESQRTGICALHHVRLVRGTAYDIVLPPRTTIDLDNDQAALWKKYPNAIYPIYKRQHSAEYRRPVLVTYCPICQRLYEREWAKHH